MMIPVMDAVLIPAYRRPEMLWHCLENIKRAHGAEEMHYIFRFDHNCTRELYDVVDSFPFSSEIAPTPQSKYLLTKQSYSLLTGYALAVQRSSRLVFMIEEDVMVATDFFRWHQEVHDQQPKLFCSIAVANPNRSVNEDHGMDAYYLGTQDYCSLGVCFDREVLRDRILHHASNAYYVNPHRYCKQTFGTTGIGDAFVEQDGLIRRIQIKECPDRAIAYPFRARAYHAGLYGANRGSGPKGNFQQRLDFVTRVIYSDEAMRTFAKNPAFYEDSKPINLNAEPWQTLRPIPLDLQDNPVRF